MGKRPQIGAKGLVFIKCNEDGTFKSSADKFLTHDDLAAMAAAVEAQKGDLILILAGARNRMRTALGSLRIEMGNRLGKLSSR